MKRVNIKQPLADLRVIATEYNLDSNGIKIDLIYRINQYIDSQPKVVVEHPKVKFECNKCHNEFEFEHNSFASALCKIAAGDKKKMCAYCAKNESPTEKDRIESVCKKLGFTLVSFNHTTRTVTYTCVCGRTQNSGPRAFFDDRTSRCNKCQKSNS